MGYRRLGGAGLASLDDPPGQGRFSDGDGGLTADGVLAVGPRAAEEAERDELEVWLGGRHVCCSHVGVVDV